MPALKDAETGAVPAYRAYRVVAVIDAAASHM